MEYVGLDKKEFEKFIAELVILFSPVSKEKAKIYYDNFVRLKVTIEQLRAVQAQLIVTKTTNWFPTFAELNNLIVKPAENMTTSEKMKLFFGE